MILPYQDIVKWASSGGVSPYDPELVNPASIDLRWSGRFRMATPNGWGDETLAECLTLHRGEFFLLDTLEYIKVSVHHAGLLSLKSSLGRSGLEHLHAGWFDPGFEGTATLEVENRAPWSLNIAKGQPIIQLALIEMKAEPMVSYRDVGRYQHQRGPTQAKKKRTVETVDRWGRKTTQKKK